MYSSSSDELSRRCRSGTSHFFSENEIEVAGILLQLPELILGHHLNLGRLPFWRSKRRRSALNDNDDTQNDNHQSSPAPPLPKAEEQPLTVTKVEASSPATPLSFSPSESDEKPKPLKRKVHLKRKREEWLEIINELTERRELLKREKETVSRYFDKLKAFNSELKARKDELITGNKRQTPNLENGQNLNLVTELDQLQPKVSSSSLPTDSSQVLHQPPLVTNQTVQVPKTSQNIHHSGTQMVSSSGFANNNASPIGLPDLNLSVSAEESYVAEAYQPLDLAMANKNLSRIMATEARRRRLQIYRVKNSIAANKLRYPCS
ncbi:hypothetical protein PanWU01x14_077490 [Parasponia andersonii]|uniref:Uncharacterized protein n=1 Tax=Parasponia andersonii TaxID=3476 RepID=A0A2P5DBP8_PARAD|nr:hypothetical protein PanWU01x14_077490 [Parasponia andersonii]